MSTPGRLKNLPGLGENPRARALVGYCRLRLNYCFTIPKSPIGDLALLSPTPTINKQEIPSKNLTSIIFATEMK
jgi:hypothetical protein